MDDDNDIGGGEDATGKEATPAALASDAQFELGAVARYLFLATSSPASIEERGVGGEEYIAVVASDGMFARVLSWLLVASNWPDSKVCVKAASLGVKMLDFVSCLPPSSLFLARSTKTKI